MLGDTPRGTKRTRPKGWGMYSLEGVLLAFHEDEDVVRRWANNRKGEAEVKVREIWEA